VSWSEVGVRHEIGAELARLAGDEATHQRELLEAHRLFTEMGTPLGLQRGGEGTRLMKTAAHGKENPRNRDLRPEPKNPPPGLQGDDLEREPFDLADGLEVACVRRVERRSNRPRRESDQHIMDERRAPDITPRESQTT